MTSRSVVIAEPVRTAIGAFGGTLRDVPAPDLGAVAIRAAVERAALKPEEIETVAMGNVIQAGTKMNPARQAAVQAGLPVTVPAMTVNRSVAQGRRRLCPQRKRSCSATPMPRLRAAWRAWIRRLISFSAVGGVIGSETDSSTTACFATG